jgi:hypothetical protein
LAIDLETIIVTKTDWVALGRPPAAPPWKIILVQGPDPGELWSRRKTGVVSQSPDEPSPHMTADRKGLEVGERLAKVIEKDPSLLQKALEKNRNWADRVRDGEKPALREWERILQYSTAARVCKILRDPSERGKRLRQSIVFTKLIKEFIDRHGEQGMSQP